MSDAASKVTDVSSVAGGEASSSRALAVRAARIADSTKASGVLVFIVPSLTCYFVIASAPNQRMVGRVVEEIETGLKAEFARSPTHVEGRREQRWVLADYGDVVVHVFHEAQRQFYAIERLYGDAPRISWGEAETADKSLSSSSGDR